MIIYVCLPIYSGSIHRSIKHTASILVCFKKKGTCATFIEPVQLQKEIARSGALAIHSSSIAFPFQEQEREHQSVENKVEKSVSAGGGGGWVGLALCVIQPLAERTPFAIKECEIKLEYCQCHYILSPSPTKGTTINKTESIWIPPCVCTTAFM